MTTEKERLDALRRAPDSVAAWSDLGRWYLDHGSPEVARLCGGRSQALDPGDRGALLLEAATTDPRTVAPVVARELFARAVNAGIRHPTSTPTCVSCAWPRETMRARPGISEMRWLRAPMT